MHVVVGRVGGVDVLHPRETSAHPAVLINGLEETGREGRKEGRREERREGKEESEKGKGEWKRNIRLKNDKGTTNTKRNKGKRAKTKGWG